MPGDHHRNHPPGATGVTAGSNAPDAWRPPPQPPTRRDRRDGREQRPGCLATTTATTRLA
ncbi:hypothetical protein [Actinoplanes lobatus]|uniref:Uncharacterized protein n=1 Tax=Actinoplanes lobatus TaxID=113568 RepID=A0A7W7MGJ1_9ACTN|nr:hypothetical protein [Actinoplanes lobatus]MBB4749449.1 hypothetical protein [Actinoplanes lobatus]